MVSARSSAGASRVGAPAWRGRLVPWPHGTAGQAPVQEAGGGRQMQLSHRTAPHARAALAAARPTRLLGQFYRGVVAAVAAICLMAGLAGLGALVPTPFVLVTPGSALDVGSLVSIAPPIEE